MSQKRSVAKKTCANVYALVIPLHSIYFRAQCVLPLPVQKLKWVAVHFIAFAPPPGTENLSYATVFSHITNSFYTCAE